MMFANGQHQRDCNHNGTTNDPKKNINNHSEMERHTGMAPQALFGETETRTTRCGSDGTVAEIPK